MLININVIKQVAKIIGNDIEQMFSEILRLFVRYIGNEAFHVIYIKTLLTQTTEIYILGQNVEL